MRQPRNLRYITRKYEGRDKILESLFWLGKRHGNLFCNRLLSVTFGFWIRNAACFASG